MNDDDPKTVFLTDIWKLLILLFWAAVFFGSCWGIDKFAKGE